MSAPEPTPAAAWPGVLGAQAVADGVWFAIEAPAATTATLCLFEPGAARESRRVTLVPGPRPHVRVAFVPGLAPGAEYGYRVDGPFDPAAGYLCNPNKLLLDPWARRLSGPVEYHPAHRAQTEQGLPHPADSAPTMPRSVVVDDTELLQAAAAAVPGPSIAMTDTVLYECHVRGMTVRHPDVPEPLRGTYRGLCHPAVVEHLRSLSVTTVSLLPLAECYDEQHLVERGLRNYWGYAPVACFAPTRRYATAGGDPRAELRAMVDSLHAAGLEVVVDVVFNHTPEGTVDVTCLNLRGLDQAAYYAMTDESPRVLIDHTGCGNSLDLSKPSCLRFVMDALRHWVQVFGIDGFRFDLATTLARTPTGFAPDGPFLSAIMQDPVLRHCKLIAEPWDVGLGGYRLGGFPPGFSEWNDRFRDSVRRVFRGEPGHVAELATRLAGSSDLFGAPGRGPGASINFVISHDGFTLRDLVSYADKHNEANGENNRDGHNGNLSDNYGHEGATEDARIEDARQTAIRGMLLCLVFAQGVPMLSQGDELGRTQCGNNNAYCQDNALSYLDWSDPYRHHVLPFLRRALALRMRLHFLRPTVHMHGEIVAGRPDLTWLRPDGGPMATEDWQGHALGMRVCGAPGQGVLLLVNGGPTPRRFHLPDPDRGYRWRLRLDAASERAPATRRPRAFAVAARSAALFEMEDNA